MDSDHGGLSRRCARAGWGRRVDRQGQHRPYAGGGGQASRNAHGRHGDADIAALRELQALGVKMEVRNLPSDEPDSMNALLY